MVRPIPAPRSPGVPLLFWRDLGSPAAAIGSAVVHAVDAARMADRPAFIEAAAQLQAQPVEQTGLLLGALVRSLLEDQHGNGLDEDDIRLVLSRCYADAVRWLPASTVSVGPLVAVLSSSLGIHEPGITYHEVTGSETDAANRGEWVDPEIGHYPGPSSAPVADRVPTVAEYNWHAPLLIADLLTSSGRQLPPFLDRAFAEIARAEFMELP